MLGITVFGDFVAAVLVFLMIPGPGTFALLTATGKGGLRAGAAATFGLIAGDQVLMWLAAAGVAAVLKANPALFQALQYAGAAYLCWVGLRLAFTRGAAAGPIPMQVGHCFRQALLITLLNPKAIVFYMAFFPLFIDPATHRGLTTFAAMAITIAVVTVVYCLLLCAFADLVAARVRAHRRLADALRGAAGVVLVAFGLRLDTQS
jgi:threonine/homoserine/homoserine lactone efflux protein